MNNSVYGKTIKKKISLRLLYNAKNYEPHKNNFWGEKEAKRLFKNFHFIIHLLKNDTVNVLIT